MCWRKNAYYMRIMILRTMSTTRFLRFTIVFIFTGIRWRYGWHTKPRPGNANAAPSLGWKLAKFDLGKSFSSLLSELWAARSRRSEQKRLNILARSCSFIGDQTCNGFCEVISLLKLVEVPTVQCNLEKRCLLKRFIDAFACCESATRALGIRLLRSLNLQVFLLWCPLKRNFKPWIQYQLNSIRFARDKPCIYVTVSFTLMRKRVTRRMLCGGATAFIFGGSYLQQIPDSHPLCLLHWKIRFVFDWLQPIFPYPLPVARDCIPRPGCSSSRALCKVARRPWTHKTILEFAIKTVHVLEKFI